MVQRFKVIMCVLLGLVGVTAIAIVVLTLSSSSGLLNFISSKPLKSDLKCASEIEYKEYVGDEEEPDVTDEVSVEWVINHWYEGFEPSTVFYEDVDRPATQSDIDSGVKTQEALLSYAKDLLKTDDLTVTTSNVISSCVGSVTVVTPADRTYLLSMITTDETAEGKCSIFHSEVIYRESK